MKRFLSFFLIITIMTGFMMLDSGWISGAEASGEEYVLLESGTVPNRCTLDESVLYNGNATAKWHTKGASSQIVLNVGSDLSEYDILTIELYSPKATDDTIGIQILDSDSYSIKTVTVDWEGWETVEYKASEMTNTDLSDLKSVMLWDHGWKFTYGDANEASDKNGSLNIGRIYFSKRYSYVGERAVVDLDEWNVPYATSETITKLASRTIAWTDQVSRNHLDFPALKISDFTAYSHLTFWMYSEKATGSELLVGLKSENGYYSYKIYIDFVGWKQFKLPIGKFTKNSNGDLSKITSMWMYAEGWGMTPNSETKIYVDSILAENLPEIEAFEIASTKYPVADMNLENDAYPVSEEICKTASKSIAWTNQTSLTHLDFNEPLITDWSGFTHLTVWIYSEKATGSECLIGVVKEKDGEENGYFTYGFDVDFVGWKQIVFPISTYTAEGLKVKRLWMYADGWGMTPNPDTKVYVDSIYLENNSAPGFAQTMQLSFDCAEEINNIANNIVFWHNGDSSIFKYGKKLDTTSENIFITSSKKVYMPASYYEIAFDAIVSGSNITVDGITKEFTPKEYNGESYYLLNKVAESFGYEWYRDEGIVVVSPGKLDAYISASSKAALNQLMTSKSFDEISIDDADFEAVMEKWTCYLTGNGYEGNKAFASKRAALANKAMSLLSSMSAPNLNASDSSGTYILGYWNKPVRSTADMRVQSGNMYQMALGYATEGTKAYKNEKLKAGIFEVMNWLYENIYGTDEMNNTGWRDTTLFNWHEWQIGVPTDITRTLMLMRDEMEDEEIKKYLAVTDHFTQYESASGTNLVHMLAPRFISCLLRRDGEEFFKMKAFLESDMTYRTTTDGHGMYKDGSYKYHYYYAMNGTYGSGYIEAVAELMSILGDSPFELSGFNIDNFTTWIFKGYVPTVFDGRMMTMFRGRSPGGEQDVGKVVINSLLRITDYMTEEQQSRILPWLKHQITESGIDEGSLCFASIIKYDELMADETILPQDSESLFNSYYVTDKAVWKTDDYAVAISMNSSRTSGWESINGANKTGWYQGDGVTYIYDGNADNFSSSYFAYADPYMLPGTTVDSQKRIAETIRDSEVYKSSKDFVGSLEIDGRYGISAMELESYHSEGGTTVTDYGNSPPAHENDLVAKKSWFVFDDEMVCLGSGINSTMNSEVKTVVENRIDASKTISTDSGSIALSGETDISDASFAHIDGTGGYIFEGGQSIKAKSETNTKTFTKMWITHGENPENADYAYTLLPGATLEETKAYSQNKDTEILINTPEIQAVHDKSTGITSYVFWEAGSFDGLTTSEPMIVSKKYEGSKVVLSVCDPSQTLESASITISDEYGDEKIDFSFPTPRGDTLELEIYPKAPVEAYVCNDEVLKLKNNGNQKVLLFAAFASYDGIRLGGVTSAKYELNPGEYADIEFDEKNAEKIFIWQMPELCPVYEPLIIN